MILNNDKIDSSYLHKRQWFGAICTFDYGRVIFRLRYEIQPRIFEIIKAEIFIWNSMQSIVQHWYQKTKYQFNDFEEPFFIIVKSLNRCQDQKWVNRTWLKIFDANVLLVLWNKFRKDFVNDTFGRKEKK